MIPRRSTRRAAIAATRAIGTQARAGRRRTVVAAPRSTTARRVRAVQVPQDEFAATRVQTGQGVAYPRAGDVEMTVTIDPSESQVYQRGARGTAFTEHFQNAVVDEVFGSRDGGWLEQQMTFLVTKLRGLRRGHAIASLSENDATLEIDPLLGLSVREIHGLCQIAGLPLKEIYISGSGRVLRDYVTEGGDTRKARYGSVRITNICLADVLPAGDLDDSTGALSVQDYLRYMDQSLTGESSSIDSWFLTGNVRIARKNPYPRGAPVRVQTRIAAFDKLIPWDTVFTCPLPGRVFWFDREEDAVMEVFVPGGKENCVFACLKWCLAKVLVEDDVSFRPEVTDLSVRQEASSQIASEYVKTVLETFREIRVNMRLAVSPCVIRNVGYQAARLKYQKEFDNSVREGLSPYLVKCFIRFLLESGGTIHPEVKPIFLFLHRFVDENTLREEYIPFKDAAASIAPFTLSSPDNYYDIHLLEAFIEGSLYYPSRFNPSSGGEDDSCSKRVNPITHAIGLANPPVKMFPNGEVSFLKQIHQWGAECFVERLKEVFSQFIKFASPKSFTEDCALQVPKLVHEQNERREYILGQLKGKDKRLIDSLEEPEDTSSSPEEHQVAPPEAASVDRGKYRIGLVVYDTETVDNLPGVQDIVSEPLRSYPAYPDDPKKSSWYVPDSHPQIPYVVQWGVMNEDTEGETPPIPRESVHLCWGKNKMLGECVNDFLQELADLAEEGKYKRFYAYAHNGSGFDAYLIKSYNTAFPVKDILVTPRGILSLSIQLSPGSDVVFRDTKVFFTASLGELCKVFGVPPQFCKTDFPITRIHARNCYHDQVVAHASEYMQNDVICLAYVVRAINNVIRDLASVGEDKMDMGKLLYTSNPLYGEDVPPIAQFATLMSLISRFQKQLFYKKHSIPPPIPVDIPALRKWFSYGNVGGRTSAYWRGFFAKKASQILSNFNTCVQDIQDGRIGFCSFVHPKDTLEIYLVNNAYRHLKMNHSGCQVLDVTSLYPYAMFEYPMPTVSSEPLKMKTAEECESVLVEYLHCPNGCEAGWKLCEKHKIGGEADRNEVGFVYMFLKNVKYEGGNTFLHRSSKPLIPPNLCPRKLEGSPGGLVYSFQTNEQLATYHEKEGVEAGSNSSSSTNTPHFPSVQCYSMYDVYWMRRCGFTFEIMFGVAFPTSYVFREYTHDLYKKRIEAKEKESLEKLPKSLSTFYKLCYNGGYGINAKKDITDRLMITKQGGESEAKLRSDHKIAPDEQLVINTHSHELPTKQWILKVELIEGSCRTYAPQSPNPIGAAVTACSRHHMNLIMHRLSEENLVGYTDTDSMAVHLSGIKAHYGEAASGMINETSQAPMGTYKNDHEQGKDEIVFLSLFVAKKVKLHITLDAEGEIRVYPTFKGYNPSRVDYQSGAHVPAWMLEKRKAQAIVRAYFDGYLDEMVQTEFKRDLRGGITIDRQAKFSASMESFTGSCGVGTRFDEIEIGSDVNHKTFGKDCDIVENLIPHGSPDELLETVECPFFKDVKNPKISEVQMPSNRSKLINEKTDGITKELLLDFLDLYYAHKFGDIRKPGDDSNKGVSIEDLVLDKVLSEETPQLKEEDFVWRKNSDKKEEEMTDE